MTNGIARSSSGKLRPIVSSAISGTRRAPDTETEGSAVAGTLQAIPVAVLAAIESIGGKYCR